MSRSSSSYRSYESEDECTAWSISSETSMVDYPSDELTLFNGEDDEEIDEYSSTFDNLIELSMRLKKQYNLPEATVELERCDKIWETMQLLKKIPMEYSNDCNIVKNPINCKYDEDNESTNSTTESSLPEDRKNSISYIKYQPVLDNGNTALPNFILSVKSQKKVHHCAACGKLFSERRAFRKHSAAVHGIMIPEISKWKKNSISVNKVVRPRTVDIRTLDEDYIDKKVQPIDSLKKSGIYTEQHKIKRENSSTNEQAFAEANQAQCTYCKKMYKTYQSMQTHVWNIHGISLPHSEFKSNLLEDDKKNVVRLSEEESCERRITRNSFPASSHPVSSFKKHICRTCGMSYIEKRSLRRHALKIHGITIPKDPRFIKNEKLEQKREVKNAPVVVKSEEKPKVVTKMKQDSKSGIDRPRRACTANASYRECSNEEEEVLDNELLAISKLPTTECLLCKKAYANIGRHLKDYHRIVSPAAVIPLQTQSESNNSIENEQLPKTPGRKVYNTNLEVFINENGEQRYRCTLCKYSYASRWHVKRHHESNGDQCFRRREIRCDNSKTNDELSDPLALTDDEEVSSTIPDSQDVIALDSTIMPKRIVHPMEERRSVIIEPQSKKRKQEYSEFHAYAAADCKYTNVNAQKNNDKQSRSKDESKSMNARDTRDSSDRDSGIGISITIKKRNNSYEVVEKDGGDDEKSKDSVNSLSTESLDVLPINFANENLKSHRRESQSLNNNEKKEIVVDLTGSEDSEDVINNHSTNDCSKLFDYTQMHYGFTKRKDV